jgi:peptide/nickel transport system substrate-binding protein
MPPKRIGQDNTALGDAGAAVSKPFLGGIESVQAIDKYTVRVTMQKSDALILQRFANYPSQIMSKVAFDQVDSYAEFASHPIGTGPYTFKEFVAGDRVVIEKYDAYFGDDKATADLVTFTVVPEIVTRVAGLRSGQFDMITEVSPDHIGEINGAAETSIIGGTVLNIRGLIFDSTNETLDDARIRQALNLSIDRVALTKALYGDMTSVPNGCVSRHVSCRPSVAGVQC